jgi:hypothetical protein
MDKSDELVLRAMPTTRRYYLPLISVCWLADFCGSSYSGFWILILGASRESSRWSKQMAYVFSDKNQPKIHSLCWDFLILP